MTKSVFAELRGGAELAVYIDLKSPYTYLAIDPTRAMVASLGGTIDWRPFTLDIPSYIGSAKLDKEGAVVQSEKRSAEQWKGLKDGYRDVRRYGRFTGKTVRGTVKIWDSSLAHIAMLWAKQQGPAALERLLETLYPPFWRRELDIESAEELESMLAAADCDTKGFGDYLHGPGRSAHDQINEAAFDAGIFGVPTYLAGDEMWFGREHLPRVSWLLSGSTGPAPDVANRSFTA